MRTFAYQGFDSAGRKSRGLIEADSLKAAHERLAARGMMIEYCHPVEDIAGLSRAEVKRGGWSRAAVRAMVYRELASMLSAGIPLARALGMLAESPEHAACRHELAHARDRIREGDAPPAAFVSAGALPPLEQAALEAGARAGAFDDTLRRLADYLDARTAAAGRAQSALIYPAFIAVFALVVVVGLVGFLLPRFSGIWKDAGIELPLSTRALLVVGHHGLWAVPLLIVLGAFAVWQWRRTWRTSPAFRLRGEKRIARWPLVGPLWSDAVASRVARTLPMLLRGGVPLVDALELAGRASGSEWMGAELKDAAVYVRQGGTVADAFRKATPLAHGLAGWVEAGEASGDLAGLLDAAAERLQQGWERKLQRLTALLEPAVIIVLGLLVLWIALAVIIPLMNLNQSINAMPSAR